MQNTLSGLDKKTIQKARNRIKRQFLKGTKQPRVRLTEKKGIYKFKHYVHEVPFRVDSLGRTYWV